jgi:hypothetical protein
MANQPVHGELLLSGYRQLQCAAAEFAKLRKVDFACSGSFVGVVSSSLVCPVRVVMCAGIKQLSLQITGSRKSTDQGNLQE